jgi:purine nucleosidase
MRGEAYWGFWRAVTWVLATALVLAGGLSLTLSLPIETWRTGEPAVLPLALTPGHTGLDRPTRVWIDTDAACGLGTTKDPDDCFAVLLLAQSSDVQIVGVSTIFGNAPLAITDPTTRALLSQLRTDGMPATNVYLGSAKPLADRATEPQSPAHEMLRRALQEGPLVIVALGPLTNVAMALRDRPDLQARVQQLIAVMGRRRGHVFHPVEGSSAHSFLGHGPIFSDLNLAQDPKAAAEVLAMGLPLTLVTYDAARAVMIDATILDGMSARGGASLWVAERSRAWLAHWRNDINRPGFYPFDLLAAAYLLQPSMLACADVSVAVGDDTGLLGWLGYLGLFVVTAKEPALRPTAIGSARYCPETDQQLGPWLATQLTAR